MTSAQMAFFHSNFMLQIPHQDEHNQPSTSLAPLLPPQDFHVLGKRGPGMAAMDEEMNNNFGDEDLSDDGSQIGEKKRRLNMEQVKTLEKNFELGTKLEPERKMQLARALGLQPRQVAIWFQNRRARWKTKQLEKDYELLKRQFEAVKAENDNLLSHNHKLHAQIMSLKNGEQTESINLNKETEGSCSNRSDNSSELIKLNISTTPAINSPHRAAAGMPLFPSTMRPTGAAQQLFHNSSKMEQTVKEESLCNMFCGGMDDQTGFWPWLDQQHFN